MFEAFAKALISTSCSRCPKDLINRGNRFSVYRNNYMVGLVDALTTSFPVIVRLVGTEFFEALAHAFAAEYPPVSPILAEYGSTFADFLQEFPPVKDLPYLPDVARLEWARVFAADTVMDRSMAISSQADLDAALDVPVSLSKTASIIRSEFPVGTIWETHQNQVVEPIKGWKPEVVIVWWGTGQLRQMTLSSDLDALLVQLSRGAPFLEILNEAQGEQQATDLLNTFTNLFNQGLLVPRALNSGV